LKKVMFDSNVFDKLSEFIQVIKESENTKYEYFITNIQVEELAVIPDIKKETRIRNILMLTDLRAKLVPVSVMVLGKARLGYTRLGMGEVYHTILNEKKSNSNDAIIADTSVHEGCILITEDKDLYQRMKNNNYEVMHLQDFLSSM